MRIVLLCCLSVLASGSVAGSADDRPNFVIIYADDLGWGDLGCYGHSRFRTPSIDRLAGEGARLTRFYSTNPYCAPARASLLTGRYPFRTGMTRNPAPDAGVDDVGLPGREITLAEALRSAGYRTICIGKWHLGHRPRFYPTEHGFEEYLGILYSNDMRPVELVTTGDDGKKVVEYPVIQANLTRRYTDRALAFIEENRDRPFFLYLPHAMPHKPLAASEAFYRKSGDGLYGDVISELDASVGEIIEKLEELDLAAKTLLVFTSDNGPWYGGSTGGLRGMKGQSWEGGIRVPLFARWPGKIPAGHRSDEPAIILDLFPTLLGVAGVPVPGDRKIDGRDILPLLTTRAESPHDALFSMRGDRLSTVRSGRWKLHLLRTDRYRFRPDDWIDPRAPDGVTIIAPFEQSRPREFPGVRSGDTSRSPALFDIEADPREQYDLAEKHPEVVESLLGKARRLESERRQTGDSGGSR